MFYTVRIILDENRAEIIHMTEQRSGKMATLKETLSPNTWHVMAIEGVIEADNKDAAIAEAQRQTMAVIQQAAGRIEMYKANVLRGLTLSDYVAARNYR